MGTCTSQEMPSSERVNITEGPQGEPKPVEKWTAREVHDWLWNECEGELRGVAKIFLKEKVTGQSLNFLDDVHLKDLELKMGEQVLFVRARQRLFNSEQSDIDFENAVFTESKTKLDIRTTRTPMRTSQSQSTPQQQRTPLRPQLMSQNTPDSHTSDGSSNQLPHLPTIQSQKYNNHGHGMMNTHPQSRQTLRIHAYNNNLSNNVSQQSELRLLQNRTPSSMYNNSFNMLTPQQTSNISLGSHYFPINHDSEYAAIDPTLILGLSESLQTTPKKRMMLQKQNGCSDKQHETKRMPQLEGKHNSITTNTNTTVTTRGNYINSNSIIKHQQSEGKCEVKSSYNSSIPIHSNSSNIDHGIGTILAILKALGKYMNNTNQCYLSGNHIVEFIKRHQVTMDEERALQQCDRMLREKYLAERIQGNKSSENNVLTVVSDGFQNSKDVFYTINTTMYQSELCGTLVDVYFTKFNKWIPGFIIEHHQKNGTIKVCFEEMGIAKFRNIALDSPHLRQYNPRF